MDKRKQDAHHNLDTATALFERAMRQLRAAAGKADCLEDVDFGAMDNLFYDAVADVEESIECPDAPEVG